MRQSAGVRSEISETRPALDIHLFCLSRRCFGTIKCFQITSVTEMSDYELHDWGLVLIVGFEFLPSQSCAERLRVLSNEYLSLLLWGEADHSSVSKQN